MDNILIFTWPKSCLSFCFAFRQDALTARAHLRGMMTNKERTNERTEKRIKSSLMTTLHFLWQGYIEHARSPLTFVKCKLAHHIWNGRCMRCLIKNEPLVDFTLVGCVGVSRAGAESYKSKQMKVRYLDENPVYNSTGSGNTCTVVTV
jgi:hypothetical protein